MSENSNRLLGGSPAFLRALNAARMVAGTDTTVLLTGEQGTGKELMALEIHAASRNAEGPFITINCAGMERLKLEQELSSCEDGATVFLDEVGDLSLTAQARLLHFLETVESGRGSCTKLRIIASTTRDLSALQAQGEFREDLYFRLHIVPIEVPPLRQRSDDIILLLKQFTGELARQHGRRPPRYSVTSRNLLRQYRWPGNVRELRNLCERMVILMSGAIVQPENLPVDIRRQQNREQGGFHFVLPKEGVDLFALERDMIRQAVTMTGGNRSKAARLLGISRDTLLYRIQKHAIEC